MNTQRRGEDIRIGQEVIEGRNRGNLNLIPFKKGVSGNPKGRPVLPAHLKEVNELSPKLIRTIIAFYANMSLKELNRVIKSRKAPVIELTIASIFARAISMGDERRLGFLLDRTIGRVKDHIEIVTPEPFIVKSSQGMIEMGAEVIDAEEETEEQPVGNIS